MRKVNYVLLAAGAALAVMVGAASGALPHAPLLCKPGNTSTICLPPRLLLNQILKCRKTGTTITVPPITVTGNGGLKTITVTVNGQRIKSYSFGKPGPTEKVIRGLKVRTTGLHQGLYALTVSVVDQLGKKTSTTRRFAICKPPVFTG